MKNVETKLFRSDAKALAKKARRSRHHLTKSALLLWKFLQTKPGGNQFRQLYNISGCMGCFFSDKLKLIIRVDIINDQQQKSVEPDGTIILRITNDDLLNHFEKVKCRLEAFLWMYKMKRGYTYLFPTGTYSSQYISIREN
jgi:very-short-patch-repair endonuclease